MHRGMGSLLRSVIFSSLLLGTSVIAHAQGDPFGLQQRANAASDMIVLGVQQGISSLPPTSGQAFTYDYNAELGTFVESEQLGPTVLRSTQTIGANRLSLRFATSYFELGETFSPIVYTAEGGPIPPGTTAYTAFGMSADANVVLFNFAATYGFTDRIEATINVPFSVVDARASQRFLTFPKVDGMFPPPSQARVAAVPGTSPSIVNQALEAGVVAYRDLSFSALGADFNSGKNVGLGRISVGAKGLALATEWVDLAGSLEFFCNSPSQDEYAGSNSPSILPRVITQVKAAKHLNIFADAGYEYDFDVQELSRFVWNAGISIPVVNATFDFGAGGSLFDESIRWTPVQATGGEGVRIRAVNPSATELGTNYVDFLAGIKMRIVDGLILGGSVNVPVTDDGFRAEAIGTASIEYYFKAL